MAAAAMRDIWQYVEFCYIVEGVQYSTHKTSDLPTVEKFYSEGKGYILATSPSAHYWKGTDKPYTKLTYPKQGDIE